MFVRDDARALCGAGLVALAIAAPFAVATIPAVGLAQSNLPQSNLAQSNIAQSDLPQSNQGSAPVKDRHLGSQRSRATQTPRSEGDQAIVDGWPLYRTEKGQAAFNDTMATLHVTEGAAPTAAAFKGCNGLDCNLTLPAIGTDGWIPPGRLWVSPSEYVLFVHAPRQRNGQSYRRRPFRSMRVFVYHEFHNSSRNTDTFDTISSHSGSVFVPLYMSKQATDAYGRHFVNVVQVAPYDVQSIHATNHGSAGPGIEVAKNVNEPLEPLQGLAGILVGSIIKTAAPHLKVVNHRGAEGQPMLSAYERHLTAARASATTVSLPFVPAPAQRVTAATARLDDLILRNGASPRIAVADRGIVPPKPVPAVMTLKVRQASLTPPSAGPGEPALIEPIAPATPPCAASPTSYLAALCRQRIGARQ